jgi:uncharacterized protein YajQ (UPF0234 family)
MAQEFSFDIVSRIDLQAVDIAVQQTMKEIRARYDFKDSKATVSREDQELRIDAEDDFRIKSVQEVLRQKLVRRGVPLRNVQFGEIKPAAGASVRMTASLQQGIPQEAAREITKLVKESKLKVQASIQGDQLRVRGTKKDDLQKVMQLVRGRDLGVDVQFVNYR